MFDFLILFKLFHIILVGMCRPLAPPLAKPLLPEFLLKLCFFAGMHSCRMGM